MAITFTPGEVISWDDLNALMAQHGSPGGAKSVVKLTLTKEERERLEDDGLDPENHGRYRYYFADGSYVDAETQTPAPGETNAQGAATGTFRVVEYKPSQAYQQQARAQSPETQSPAAQRTAREETEIARNAALPPGQDPYPETDRERRERADRVIKEQGAAAQAAENKERQRKIDERNAATDAAASSRADSAEARAAAAANRPSVHLTQDGTMAVVVYPDGRVENKPTGVRGKPERVTIEGRIYERDEATGTYVDKTPMATGQSEPAGAPPMRMTYGEVSKGLEEHSRWLNEQTDLYQSSGGKQGMSPEAATKSMARRVELATAALKEQGGVVDVQSSVYGSEVTQRGQTLNDTQSRRQAANSIYNNTLSDFLSAAPKAGRGGGKYAGPAMQEALAMGRQYVDDFGGFRESPAVSTEGFPAIHDLRSRSLAPVQAPPPPPNPLAGAAVATEQAAVAGGIASPEAQGLPPPIFAPQPPVGMPTQQPIPAGPPPEEPIPAAVNPVSDQPISGPFNPPERTGGSFVQQTRAGTANQPSAYVRGLIADPSVDNDILAEAYMAEYGMPLPMGRG